MMPVIINGRQFDPPPYEHNPERARKLNEKAVKACNEHKLMADLRAAAVAFEATARNASTTLRNPGSLGPGNLTPVNQHKHETFYKPPRYNARSATRQTRV